MAGLGNQRNSDIAQCVVGGGGRLFPRSSMSFTWRDDPEIVKVRQLIVQRIAASIGEGFSRKFSHEILSLSVEFEERLFSLASSKEDYMDDEINYHRMSYLVKERFHQELAGQQKAAYAMASVLPTFVAQPPIEHKHNTSANLLDVVTDSQIAPSNMPLNLGSANGPHHSPVVMPSVTGSQANEFTRGRKRNFQVTNPLYDQLRSHMPLRVEPRCGDSNVTFSGSVLQYESEASFDSCCKSQHFNEDLSMTEPFDAKHQSYQRLAQDHSATLARSHFLETSRLIPSSDICGQLSAGDDQIRALSCFMKFTTDPKTSCLGRDTFVQYLHARRCNNACACENFTVLLDHMNQCRSNDCCIWRRVVEFYNDQQGTERLNSRIYHKQMSFGHYASNSSSPVVSDVSPTPSKVRKLNSFSSEGILFPRSHPVSLEGSPTPDQCSPPLLSSNSGDTELNVETDTPLTRYSPSISESKIDLSEDEQRLSSENASLMTEDLNDYKHSELEPTFSSEVKEKALESLSSPSSKCVTKVSGHHCTSPKNEVDKTLESFSSPSSNSVNTMSEHQCTSQTTNNAGTRNILDRTKLDVTVEPLETTSALVTTSKSETLKMQGLSLTDFFTPEEIKQHMLILKQNIDQTVAEQEFGNPRNNCISEYFCCQLCNMDKLWFPPMPIYCSPCGSRIKYRGTYYSMLDENSGQICYCSACYNKSRRPKKSIMEMKKNDDVTEESWVMCDKCEGWQHQICALFNDKRDLGGKAYYICPKCYLADLETGDCKPLPSTSCFSASNLPRTRLSDHLEQRLFQRLKKDREDRVKAGVKDLEEVLGASNLTVRVVSSVDKVLKVKQQFQDIFPDRSYPAEFPYRSKVVLLFQKIEGVDVCLFGMYVQEFGSQCSLPNQRCVYISYLDSVKYFRPEAKSVAGEALRTFVYHEILIGYLEYCKKRGFSTCYIWACPPVKGEDYILYCHPETQKTPKPDKLRQWYRSMLRKAAQEKIIVNSSNIYEQFFVPNEGCNTKVTAARLPYFDGDYWSSVADSMIKKIEKECGGDLLKKVMKKTRRSLKAMGRTDPTVTEGDAKDILLMHELAQTLSSAKEDFIIVYLHNICTHCHEVIASGKRWLCNTCKNFQLCEGCHNKDQNPEDTHISSSGQKHALSQEMVDEVPADTEDNDVIMNNCFLANRHSLLSFCQGNHYQFDTLRRAKHSSMMILYHLHHPNEATPGTTCSLCLKDAVLNQQWKCNLCPEFVVCGACYKKNGSSCHTHNLTKNLAPENLAVETKKAKMVKELLDVLLHASKCHSTETNPCNYLHCVQIRRLFSHSRVCNTRIGGGCIHCTKIWQVLRLHSQRCADSNCCVPRCRDLKAALAEKQDLQINTKAPNTTAEVLQ